MPFLVGNTLTLLSGRGGSRTAATPRMERFVIIVNGWKPLTIITKRSILDATAVLDPPLSGNFFRMTPLNAVYVLFQEFISLTVIKVFP